MHTSAEYLRGNAESWTFSQFIRFDSMTNLKRTELIHIILWTWISDMTA